MRGADFEISWIEYLTVWQSIPSPKAKVSRAFEVELLSAKTNDSNQAKAHERCCSTFILSDPVSVAYHDAANETHVLAMLCIPDRVTMLSLARRTVRGGSYRIVLDGHFGNYPATYAVRETGLHIISKFRHDAALYLPYTGPKPKRGPTPRYGQKLNYTQLPPETLCHSVSDGEYRTETYQMTVFHKSFSDALNVVVVAKTHLKTGKRAHAVLFSTDRDLTADQIVDYYSFRFQIEFNFRDAKQYWGLDDFMNVKSVAVTKAVNLAFLMVNVSVVMLRPYRHDQPASVYSISKPSFVPGGISMKQLKCFPIRRVKI
jgi:hypothetical protein